MTTAHATLHEPLAWADRWHEPEVPALVSMLKSHQQRNSEMFMSYLDENPKLHRRIVWYAGGWNWTIHYRYDDGQGTEMDNFGFVVPNPEQPLFCIPLTSAMVEVIPLRRLSKFIRDGIRSAKCAVDLHWAMWTPGPESEANQLLDLLKRKIRLLDKSAPPENEG